MTAQTAQVAREQGYENNFFFGVFVDICVISCVFYLSFGHKRCRVRRKKRKRHRDEGIRDEEQQRIDDQGQNDP